MADLEQKQIHELSTLGRVMNDTDVIAVDTGTTTRKVIPSQIKAGVIRDSYDGGNVNLRYGGDYLTPAENRPIFIAAMQRDANNTPVVATVAPSTLLTLLGISTQITEAADFTTNNRGYVRLTNAPAGAVFAQVYTWTDTVDGSGGRVPSPLSVCGDGTNWYLTGNPNVTVTGLRVRYLFIG